MKLTKQLKKEFYGTLTLEPYDTAIITTFDRKYTINKAEKQIIGESLIGGRTFPKAYPDLTCFIHRIKELLRMDVCGISTKKGSVVKSIYTGPASKGKAKKKNEPTNREVEEWRKIRTNILKQIQSLNDDLKDVNDHLKQLQKVNPKLAKLQNKYS